MEERFRFRHVNTLTGSFVLVVLALVLAGIVFSGHSQRWFSRKHIFDVRLPTKGASGLNRGSGVFILGVAVGSVDDINVGDDGLMRARVKIRGDFERFVRVDSIATIKRVFGFAGDAFMEISVGTGAELPEDQATIECYVAKELSGMLENMLTDLNAALMPVVKKASPLFDAWTNLGLDLQASTGNLDRLILRLDRIASRVEEGEGTAGGLLGDTALLDEAQKVLIQAKEAMVALRDIVTNAEAVVKNVDEGTARLPEITDALANEAKDLPGLVIQAQQMLREVERLTESLQRHWLVRKYVEPESTSGGRISTVEVPGGEP